MSARFRVLISVCLLAVGMTAMAQPDPTVERGVRPGLAYRLEGLDHVNLFNGTMTLNVPLGQSYPVNGSLSYSFMASYATNAWDAGEHDVQVYVEEPIPRLAVESYQYMYPSKQANAGFGWMVTLGKIFGRPENSVLVYVAPDGSEHDFSPTLHTSNTAETPSAGVSYTRDGTYLRLKTLANEMQLEFPNGHVHRFHLDGRLFRMEDPFGNSVDITYLKRIDVDGPTGNTAWDNSSVWKVTDSVGRQHWVYFRPGWSYIEWDYDANEVPHEMVDKVVLAAVDGGHAQYTFNYNTDTLPENATYDGNGVPNIAHRTSRRCERGKTLDPYIPKYELVGILTSLGMPHSVNYSMVTDRGDQTSCSRAGEGGASGNLTRLVLPTGGRIDWTYQPYILLKASGPNSGSASVNAGIASRKTRLADSDSAPVVQTTEYTLGKLDEASLFSDLYRLVTNKEGESTVINATKHYFGGCGTSWSSCVGGEYGLPITRGFAPQGGGYLSTEFQALDCTELPVPDCNDNLVTKRRTYLRYESDILLGNSTSFGNANQRVAYERTVYDDDGGRYADVTHSEFDGLGHYRKSVTGGDFEKGNQRTTFTNYNPSAGIFALDSNGSLSSGFTMVATSVPWILASYDLQRATEGSQTSETKFCFDGSTGALTSRRTYKNFGASPASNGADLLAVFAYDGDGNVETERYFGGEHASAPSHTCGQTPTGETYRVENRYQYGALKQSWYTNSGGSALSFFTVDREIDQNTGLTKNARRFRSNPNGADGVATTFSYDQLGRVTDADSPTLKTHYAYFLSPPKITTTEKRASDNALLRESSVQFDALGRTVKETRSMPNSVTATRSSRYSALGWTTEVTEWGASAPTVMTYDAFGRPIRIQAPDHTADNAATIAYTGVSSVTRTSKVRTSGDATTFVFSAAQTKEEYDRQGRLIRVTEPPQTVGGSGPKTEYTYDVGGRLIAVCANKLTTCGQSRTFQYDNRGLLTSETHPESGTTTYDTYDAKGHLRRRYVATGSFDLRFTYDRAERLTDVDEGLTAATTRPFKRFIFDTVNSGSNLKNGQLLMSVRWNWLPNDYTVQVAETYGYDAEGRPIDRTTADYFCAPGVDCTAIAAGTKQREFQQSFAYDALGATSTINYPTCIVGGCTGIAGRTITNAYSNGFLTDVSWGGNSNGISYHDSGLVKVVTHDNGVTDSQSIDLKVPSRPEAIVTANIQKTGCVAPTFTSHPQSTTITSPGTATLTASATGDTGSTIAYQWYRGTAPDTATPVGTNSPSYAAQPTTTTSYWVRASNSCGAADSQTATVTICVVPNIGTGVTNKTITRGQHAHLSASNITGSAPLSYQWYTYSYSTDVETPIAGATGTSIDVYPDQDTTYRFRVTNACGSVFDPGGVDVSEPATVPANVQAGYDASIGKVRVTWTASTSEAGILSYLIQRVGAAGLQTYATNGPVTTWEDPDAVTGNAYIYRVQAKDSNLAYSDSSGPDVAWVRAFTDEPVNLPNVSGGTLIRGVHISELRQAVDAVRVATGLPAAWSSYSPATGTIDDAHLTQLRDKLNEARVALALDAVTFTDAVAGDWLIKGSNIRELRDGVK